MTAERDRPTIRVRPRRGTVQSAPSRINLWMSYPDALWSGPGGLSHDTTISRRAPSIWRCPICGSPKNTSKSPALDE